MNGGKGYWARIMEQGRYHIELYLNVVFTFHSTMPHLDLVRAYAYAYAYVNVCVCARVGFIPLHPSALTPSHEHKW